MRAYTITAGPLTYTSLNPDGSSNPAALDIEVDVSLTAGDVPAQGSRVQVLGIGLSDISQSRNLFNQPFKLTGGMAVGLPLANPAQAGTLCTGMIWRAFGNWVGTNQSLDLIISPGSSPPTKGGQNPQQPPTPIVLNWKKGQELGPAVQQALTNAFPGMKIKMAIGKFTAPSDQVGFHANLTNFGYYLRRYTQALGGAGSFGVGLHLLDGGITVADGTQARGGAGRIDYQDLVGQPTWIDVNKISITLVMRGDLHVNDVVTLPRTLVTNTASGGYGSGDSPQQSLTFQGTFMITSIRHVGRFRQPDAGSWVTILEATEQSGGA